MKRSRTIRLALLGSASALALVSCEEAKDPLAEAGFFRDPAECARQLDRAACEQSFAEAQREHLRSAPAFASREACEQAYGAANCAWQETNVSPDQVQEQRQGTTASGGGGWFMPMMMGYMLGNALGNRAAMPPGGQTAAAPPPASGGASAARPVYRNAKNEIFSGRTSLGTSRVAATSTTSRGGFGTTSRSFTSSSSS